MGKWDLVFEAQPDWKNSFEGCSLTNLAHVVDFAKSLRFVFFCPRLEELFKHGRLRTIVHNLHIGGGRITFGLDETLGGSQPQPHPQNIYQ